MGSDSDSFAGTPPDITETAKNINLNLLPAKSKLIYEKRYSNFISWCEKKKIKSYSESVLLVYFDQELKQLQSSSLWSIYSMLRSTLCYKHNVDISKYHKLIAFLKRKSAGYKPKKSKTLDLSEITTFLIEASDEVYLMKKVSIILIIL